jgi:hypothetical protein
MDTLNQVLDAVQAFSDKLGQVGDLKRLNKKQRALIVEAAQIVMRLPRQLLDGESSYSPEQLRRHQEPKP